MVFNHAKNEKLAKTSQKVAMILFLMPKKVYNNGSIFKTITKIAKKIIIIIKDHKTNYMFLP